MVAIETPNATVQRTWDQAVRDLEALRLEDPTFERGVVVPAAGVPWFVTLFGRDTLVVSMQAISGYPEFAAGALRRLGAMQATGDDPERDMEPGKIPHEVRHGELAQLGILPYQPYYGTHDATSLYLIVLLVPLPVARRRGGPPPLPRQRRGRAALDRHVRRSRPRRVPGVQDPLVARLLQPGLEGRRRRDPAWPTARSRRCRSRSCELQGYVYDAKLRMGDIYEILGRPKDARRLRREARTLYERVNDADVVGGGGDLRPSASTARRSQIRSVASNAGHLLQSGIVPPERAGAGRQAAAGRRHVVGLGHPDAVVGSRRPTTRSATRPAASGRTTTR